MPLKIMPHGRLQEWVAEEKGFFTAEGLDYTFLTDSGDYGIHSVQRDDAGEVRTGAFETFGAGRDGADVSCACHWATAATVWGVPLYVAEAFGTGERIVFLDYTRENFEATRRWTQAHDLFSGPPSAGYDQAALV